MPCRQYGEIERQFAAPDLAAWSCAYKEIIHCCNRTLHGLPESGGFSALFGMRRMIGCGQMSSWNMPPPVFSRWPCSVLPLVQARQPVAPVRDAVEVHGSTQTAVAGEVSIETGRIDANNQLPACQHLEAFLPAGARAWGAVTVGSAMQRTGAMEPLCTFAGQGRRRLPGRCQRRSARARRSVGEHRARVGDVVARCRDVLTDAVQAVGFTCRCYAVAVGQLLRAGMLILPPVVRQRDQVRVVHRRGLQREQRGQGSQNAAAGQVVKVRLAADGHQWRRPPRRRGRGRPLNDSAERLSIHALTPPG